MEFWCLVKKFFFQLVRIRSSLLITPRPTRDRFGGIAFIIPFSNRIPSGRLEMRKMQKFSIVSIIKDGIDQTAPID